MAQVRVMLVDDSPLFLGALKAAISKDPSMMVVGTASNGQQALDTVPGLRPDVIICDVQMPKMSGIEFLKRLLPKHPVPVVVISSTPGVTLTALSNGAVDFIPKPAADEPRDLFFRRVIDTVKTAAASNISAKMRGRATAKPEAPPPMPAALARTPSDYVVAIGASTGGTDAILAVVRNLPANFPGIVATQHMPPGFTAMYANRLDKECNIRVFEAKDGQRLETGTMLLAPGDRQMKLMKDANGYYVTARPGEKVNGHMPSVEVLFNSVAEATRGRSAGVILTGMGGDGAEGLLKMRRTGSYTIGQDKESSVVYGMPMVAFNKGAVAKQLPLDKITDELIRYVSKMQ